MIDTSALDAAYEQSQSTTISPQIRVAPGDLAGWLDENLPIIVNRWGGKSLNIAVELVAIGIIAGQNDTTRN